MKTILKTTALICLLFFSLGESYGAPEIKIQRVPEGGIQPKIRKDPKGTIHLVFFKGKADSGDLYYCVKKSSSKTFSNAIKINSQAGSAIATGTIRGAQVVIGKLGQVHVVWNGSKNAKPRARGGQSPMLYTRLNESRSAFETERNVIRNWTGLDGGGGIAADGKGKVYVFWHAFGPGRKAEENRRVFMAKSEDGGKTFMKEKAIFKTNTGCCACCGLGAIADQNGQIYVMYRTATKSTERGMLLLTSKNHGKKFKSKSLGRWNLNSCIMSSANFTNDKLGVLAAWEHKAQIYMSRISSKTMKPGKIISAQGQGENRKHGFAVSNQKGQVLLVWSEGTAWNRGGSIAWQLYDDKGRAVKGMAGTKKGLPAWSFPAAYSKKDGSFVIVF